jgi:serine protease Do
VEISSNDDQKAGNWVTAIGHPWGIANSVTSGVLIDNDQIPAPEKQRGWIAASVHVRPGNSGGPLVDVHGRLLGINTVMAGPEVGLAISAQVIKGFLEEYARETHQPLGDDEHDEAPKPQYV